MMKLKITNLNDQLRYLNQFEFIDIYGAQLDTHRSIPYLKDVRFSVNSKNCLVHKKGGVSNQFTDDIYIKLYSILQILSGNSVNVKIDSMDSTKKKQKNEKKKKKNPKVDNIKINYIFESECTKDSLFRSAIYLFSSISSQINLKDKIQHYIIPHSHYECKLVLKLPLSACIILTDLEKNLLKEFSFNDILLKVEFILANDKKTLTPKILKSCLYNVYPFNLLKTKNFMFNG